MNYNEADNIVFRPPIFKISGPPLVAGCSIGL